MTLGSPCMVALRILRPKPARTVFRMLLNQFRGKRNHSRQKPGETAKPVEIQGFSAGREREPGLGFFRHGVAMRATGAAGLGAGAEGFVNDGLDGARASPAFGAASEATVNLLGVARQISGRFDGATDIMVAQDVT